VIGGAAGTQAAASSRWCHVELIERRPFLSGRAPASAQCSDQRLRPVPADDRRAGRHAWCFHRNVAVDTRRRHRRSTVEAVTGHPGDFQVGVARCEHHRRLVNCGTCETVCEVVVRGGKKAIFTGFYDGRVIHRRPRDLHLLRHVRRGVPGQGRSTSRSLRSATVNASV
jgi:heterodisulfide reductase subunit A-like polyferredoxin